MATTVWGTSDDLIEFDGDVYGEVGCYGTDERERGVLVVFSDGTLIEVKYGKNDRAIWGINVIQRGPLCDRFTSCDDEDAKIYSDTLAFKDGLKWAYAATDWERVR